MRRHLIKQEDFDSITKGSITNSEVELREAEELLSKALQKDHLKLRCFNESTALFETLDGTYVHAGYEVKDDDITFSGIEELIVDHDSKKNKMKSTLSEMIDALLVDNTTKATSLLENYMGLFNWQEATKRIVPDSKKGGYKAIDHEPKKDDDTFSHDHKTFSEKSEEEHNKDKKSPSQEKQDDDKKDALIRREKAAGNEIAECYTVAENVLDYVQYMRLGPALAESVSKTDENGNVTQLKVPTRKVRNEGKVLNFNWKTLNHNVKVLRDGASSLCENQNFCRACVDLKRQNNVSDNEALQEVLENIVGAFPNVLYVTQTELAKIIGESLRIAGEKNYDDNTCAFMAEGILRTAHDAHTERVQQILHLASAPKLEEDNADHYLYFQHVVESFYPAIDERFGLERKVFSDLYESLEKIYKKADRRGDTALKNETASYLNDLAAVLNNQAKPELELAEEVASWSKSLVETNLETGVWSVSNNAHVTVSGDHPDMAKKAKHSYKPSSDFSGNWGDAAPAIGQDSMNYKGSHADEMRGRSWGNTSKETFPSLKNPYVPSPFGDYTMKGEKGVDKDTFGQHHGSWQSSDTWPALQNPYVPKEAGGVGGKGHKATIDNKDLVVNK